MGKLGRGELEARVMDIVWDAAEALTPRDVYAVLRRRRQGVAYTTVMTIMVRLWQKRMLTREEQGRSFAYRPVAGRDEWTAKRMREILEDSGDRTAALTHFVESMDAREATQLRHALARRRRR